MRSRSDRRSCDGASRKKIVFFGLLTVYIFKKCINGQKVSHRYVKISVNKTGLWNIRKQHKMNRMSKGLFVTAHKCIDFIVSRSKSIIL